VWRRRGALTGWAAAAGFAKEMLAAVGAGLLLHGKAHSEVSRRCARLLEVSSISRHDLRRRFYSVIGFLLGAAFYFCSTLALQRILRPGVGRMILEGLSLGVGLSIWQGASWFGRRTLTNEGDR